MCYNPITIKTPQGYQKVPCGHCLECLRKYQNDWSNRMYEEMRAHDGKAVFFTLTYSDDCVPKNYLVDQSLYRSYSDYAYDNTVIRLVGKKILRPKVCSIVSGERVKTGVPADKCLTDAGIYDYDIIDFNVKRNKQEKFIEHVQRIYGDYLRLVSSTLPLRCGDNGLSVDLEGVEDWFDNYEGDMFSYDDLNDTEAAFHEVLSDDDYDDGDVTDMVDDSYRNRPVMSFNSVRKEDVIKWLNRGLNKIKRNFNHGFTYYVTAEYGPRTLRPHYHGILFGVTREEAQCMFSDWNRHFGFSKIENVQGGAPSYCAKYCAKGMYEHPLCAKDFFYFHKDGRFTEYHSKHYERCVEIFGVDFPIVDPVFHLMSKGLGASYVDNMRDFFVKEFDDINFASEGTPTLAVTRDTPDNLIEFLTMDTDEKKKQYIETYKIRRKDKNYYERQFADAMDEFVKKFKYSKVTPKGETISYGMPQYYRAKILSDGLRSALACYVREVNDNLYREKFAQLQAADPTRKDTEIVSILEAEDQAALKYRRDQARKRAEKQLNKSKL